jgi:hypothetical protein
MWTLILNHHIHLSQSYAKIYMMTCSMFYTEPLRVHLTGSTSEGFVDRYVVMEEIKNTILNWRRSLGVWHMEIQYRRYWTLGFVHWKWFLSISAQNLVNFVFRPFSGGKGGGFWGATDGHGSIVWMTFSLDFKM